MNSDTMDPIDPTKATDPSLNRRAFVGLGAATAVVGSIATALAQGEGFGKPHPPIVTENDPEILVLHEKLKHTGRTIDAYAALPKRQPSGAVVVAMHIWGVDTQIRDTVRRFAKEGYVAIAPDLYTGLGAPNGDDATDIAPFRDVSAKLSAEGIDADLHSAGTWAATPPPVLRLPPRTLKVGVTGFCSGGAIALRQTAVNAGVFAAGAVWYGSVTNVRPSDVKIPLLGSYGGRDTSIPANHVRTFFAELSVPHDLKVYDEAGHAFFDDTRKSYVASAASDAWRRTLEWFTRHLTAS
jgi:carboxymethylenebutenolidase